MKKASETNQTLDPLVRLALEMGAVDAKIISPKDVEVADWVRLKCQYGCPAYAKHLTCPPYSPTPQQTRQILQGYRAAILMQLPDEEDATRDWVANLERSIFLQGYYRAFAMVAGPCQRCPECNLKQCVHPRRARPSMEACGIDVYATARKHDYNIDVRRTTEEKPTYYGLVLIE